MTMIQLIACIGMIAGLFMVLHVSPRELSDSLFSCLTAAPGSCLLYTSPSPRDCS